MQSPWPSTELAYHFGVGWGLVCTLPIGAHFAPPRRHPGPVRASFGPVWATSGPVRASLGPVWATSGPVRASLGPVWATSGPVRASLGPFRATLRSIAKPCVWNELGDILFIASTVNASRKDTCAR